MEPVDIVRTLRTCDSDLMSLIKLPERTLLNVKRDDELCNDIDNTIDTASDDVKDLLEQALEAPLALCATIQRCRGSPRPVDPTLHVKQFAKNSGQGGPEGLRCGPRLTGREGRRTRGQGVSYSRGYD